MTRPVEDVLTDKAAAETALAEFLAAHPDPYQDAVRKVELEGLIRRRKAVTNEWLRHPIHAAPAPEPAIYRKAAKK